METLLLDERAISGGTGRTWKGNWVPTWKPLSCHFEGKGCMRKYALADCNYSRAAVSRHLLSATPKKVGWVAHWGLALRRAVATHVVQEGRVLRSLCATSPVLPAVCR